MAVRQSANASRLLHLCVLAFVFCAGCSFSAHAYNPPRRSPSVLEIVTNKADQASRTNPRSAITNYYEPQFNSAAFNEGTIVLQERFLFEYLQACNRAAANTPRLARRYRKLAVVVATRYIEWFGRIEQRKLAEKLLAIRITRVVVDLGSSRILTGARDELIADYEAIPLDKAYYFDRGSLKLWEDSLRTYPNYRQFQSESAVRRLIRSDKPYRVHWEAFKTVLERLKNDGPTRTYAKVRLVAIEQLMPGPAR